MRRRLLIPGPTEVSPEILNEQARPVISHRGRDFTALYTGINDKLSAFLRLPASYKVTVTASSGTLWFDIVGRSIIEKKALACINGAFASRFGEILRACGKQTDFLEVDWGKAVKPDMIAEKLDSGTYDTLVLCHNESSTGVRNPVYEIGRMVRDEYPDVILAIDSVSGMGGDKIIPSEIGCDVIFTSSQKCFALPPGLAIGVVSEKALERARQVPYRGGYTDLVEIFNYYEKNHQTPFTPNIPLLFALDKRLDLMIQETYDEIYRRHKSMAEYTQKWARKHFTMFPEPGFESVTVSCVKNTLGKSVRELNEKLAEKGYMISNGYGKLAEKTFRIGHMGIWALSEIEDVLATIDEIWELAK
jgi:predicted phosphoserine aminotransferase